jgi:hypothetical protein
VVGLTGPPGGEFTGEPGRIGHRLGAAARTARRIPDQEGRQRGGGPGDAVRGIPREGEEQGPVDFEIDAQVGLHSGRPFLQYVVHDLLSFVRVTSEWVVRRAVGGYSRLLQ